MPDDLAETYRSTYRALVEDVLPVIEDAITPAPLRDTNACVYLTLSIKLEASVGA